MVFSKVFGTRKVSDAREIDSESTVWFKTAGKSIVHAISYCLCELFLIKLVISNTKADHFLHVSVILNKHRFDSESPRAAAATQK